ncbi:MAG: hypothetical protein ACRC4L_00200, partial [Mycoplasma sp.]
MKDKELDKKEENIEGETVLTESPTPKKKKISTWKVVTGVIILSLFITGMTTNLYYLVNKKKTNTPAPIKK